MFKLRKQNLLNKELMNILAKQNRKKIFFNWFENEIITIDLRQQAGWEIKINVVFSVRLCDLVAPSFA